MLFLLLVGIWPVQRPSQRLREGLWKVTSHWGKGDSHPQGCWRVKHMRWLENLPCHLTVSRPPLPMPFIHTFSDLLSLPVMVRKQKEKGTIPSPIVTLPLSITERMVPPQSGTSPLVIVSLGCALQFLLQIHTHTLCRHKQLLKQCTLFLF